MTAATSLMRGTGDADADWIMREDIRVAEWWYTERQEDQAANALGRHPGL
jgi:hypothetical protein